MMQRIYTSHGWPQDYRAVECRQAVEAIPDPDADFNEYSDDDTDLQVLPKAEERIVRFMGDATIQSTVL